MAGFGQASLREKICKTKLVKEPQQQQYHKLPDHKTKSEFFLQNGLDVHHVQLLHQRSVDHHNFVMTTQSVQTGDRLSAEAENIGMILSINKATITYGSTFMTKTRRSKLEANSDSTENPNNVSFDSRTKSMVKRSCRNKQQLATSCLRDRPNIPWARRSKSCRQSCPSCHRAKGSNPPRDIEGSTLGPRRASQ